MLSLSCFAEETSQTKNYSVGLGMGAMYSGIGANIALVSKNDFKYISAGCTRYDSTNGAECGFGVGWVTADLFDFETNNHGFGIYATMLGKERFATFENHQYSFYENNYYGAGVSYTYFVNGIDQSGVTFGISIHATNAENDGRFGSFFQIGYQF
tara:strand:+ start:77 stop:541 length:465 start_codon:yes stop_codon:yes gene_type:complete